MAQLLLIEPDSLLSRIYIQAFEAVGHDVGVAYSAQEAIDRADEAHPDMVILELQLPRHNGLEFLYEFRSYAEWLKVPVIIQSFVPPQEFLTDSSSWRLLGVVEYLYKPRATLQQLLFAVNEQLAIAV